MFLIIDIVIIIWNYLCAFDDPSYRYYKMIIDNKNKISVRDFLLFVRPVQPFSCKSFSSREIRDRKVTCACHHVPATLLLIFDVTQNFTCIQTRFLL